MDAFQQGVDIRGKICSPRAKPLNDTYWTSKELKHILGMKENAKRSKKQLCKDLFDFYSINLETLLGEGVIASTILGSFEDDTVKMCASLPSSNRAHSENELLREFCNITFYIDVELLTRRPGQTEYLWSVQVLSKMTGNFKSLKRHVERVMHNVSAEHPSYGKLVITQSFAQEDSYIVLGRSKANEQMSDAKFMGSMKLNTFITIQEPRNHSPEFV